MYKRQALEGVGAALDATGIFAPFGALFGAAGGANIPNLAESAAEEGGEVVGKELAGTALDGVGAALDATGIFAPFGA